MPRHDKHWVRSSSGAGCQLLTELPHATSALSTQGGKEEGAQAFPWGGQEGQRTSMHIGASLRSGLEPALGSCSPSETLWDDEQLSY